MFAAENFQVITSSWGWRVAISDFAGCLAGCLGGTSGASGAYQIDGLPTDDYHVCFDSPDGSAEKCLPSTVHVNAGAVTPNVNGGPGN